MIQWIDDGLNRITMYRLVLYYLLSLLAVAECLCLLGVLPYSPLALPASVAFLVAICWASNTVFAKTYQVPVNVESAYISALILALIITPLGGLNDLWFLGWAALWAMASKYILAIDRKHIFNPVAFAVALTALTLNQTASWWIGTAPMLPFVLGGGVLVVRKTRRTGLVVSFLGVSLVTTLALAILSRSDLLATLQSTVLYSPWLFFACVILTEPLTLPPTTRLQLYEAAVVGFLFAPQLHLGPIYLTPELSILVGNVYAYLVSPKGRYILTLVEKLQIAPDVYDFVFAPDRQFAFAAGQYMEWTLAHERADARGNRRYFTLASSPTEKNLRLGVKFYPRSSSFKQSMLTMDRNSQIVASQLSGDFTLPPDPQQKCVFIAGGIGITPFRSMLKYLLDTQQKRPIVLFNVNRTAADLVYDDVLQAAQTRLGVKVVNTLTDSRLRPSWWKGRWGYIDEQMVMEEVPDYRHCVFYLSGPNALVESFQRVLARMGLHAWQIKTDFFPGFA